MNLVIGKTSQLAQYFPNDYIKISSRNVDFDYLKNNNWDSVYITFSEQRIYDANINYITPNYFYTLDIINALLDNSKKIVCYTSCELWNKLSGYITLQTEPQFSLNNEYVISKLLLWNKIKELRKINDSYNKIIFVHPFYFNSVFRSEYFLFGKIFNSIIYKKKIKVGNLNFYRDMIHPSYLSKKSIELQKDSVIGSGKLFNVRDFIIDLYELNQMNFYKFVDENISNRTTNDKLIMADVDWNYTYENLLADTHYDIQQRINGNI